jgi:hypothetical protein
LISAVSGSVIRISVKPDTSYSIYATASKGDFQSNAGKNGWATVDITSATEPDLPLNASCEWIGSLRKCGVHMPKFAAVRQFG